MWRAILTTLTVGWEIYAIVAVSDTGVGFLDVALLVSTACLLAIAWALPWSAAARGRPSASPVARATPRACGSACSARDT